MLGSLLKQGGSFPPIGEGCRLIRGGDLSFSEFKKTTKPIYDDDLFLSYFGAQLLEHLVITGYVKRDIVQMERGIKNAFYSATSEVGELLSKVPVLLDLPVKLPMIVEPKKYTTSINNRDVLGG